jgi:hypothetical protein
MSDLRYDITHELVYDFVVKKYLLPKQLVPYMRKHNDVLGAKLDVVYKSQGHYGVLNTLLPNDRLPYCIKYTEISKQDTINIVASMNDNTIDRLVRDLVYIHDITHYYDWTDRQMITSVDNVDLERQRLIDELTATL